MLNRKLHPADWQQFFDELSASYRQDDARRYVRLRVSVPDTAQPWDVAHWVELRGISYKPGEDVLHVMLDGLTHQITRPDVIWAAVEPDGAIDRLVVLHAAGSRHLIEFSTHRFPYDPASASSYFLQPDGPGGARNARRSQRLSSKAA